MRTVHQQYADRLREVTAAVASKKAMLRYQQTRRASYRNIVGNCPPKPTCTARGGRVGTGGFRVERVVFESAPLRYCQLVFAGW